MTFEQKFDLLWEIHVRKQGVRETARRLGLSAGTVQGYLWRTRNRQRASDLDKLRKRNRPRKTSRRQYNGDWDSFLFEPRSKTSGH